MGAILSIIKISCIKSRIEERAIGTRVANWLSTKPFRPKLASWKILWLWLRAVATRQNVALSSIERKKVIKLTKFINNSITSQSNMCIFSIYPHFHPFICPNFTLKDKIYCTEIFLSYPHTLLRKGEPPSPTPFSPSPP